MLTKIKPVLTLKWLSTDLFSIIHIFYMAMQAGQGKSVLQLRVAGSAELLTITCPSMAEAENMADLVDGYCRLVNQSSTSIWSRKGKSMTICSGF